jgi:carbonic anhydrase/acetyltransferase-like protein (isoleucine patch superfamily)
MLIHHRGAAPTVHPTAYLAPNATLVGNVIVGPRARVMYGAVLDAEGSRIEVGEACVVAENAVLRATAVAEPEWPVLLGDHVFVGPHATVLGARVHRCAYLATGAVVLQGATIGAGACVAVHALVHARTRVEPEAFVGPHTVAVGDPAEVFTPDREEAIAAAIREINFAGAAFGTASTWGDRTQRYKEIAEVRVAEFGAHADDQWPAGIDASTLRGWKTGE